MAWQLINKKTDEIIHGPGPLPENWGPICGVAGFLETHGDMAAVGMPDLEWVQLPDPEPSLEERVALVKETVKQLLLDSDWAMLPDVPMTIGEKEMWIEYRDKLRNTHLQPGYPDNTAFPTPPR